VAQPPRVVEPDVREAGNLAAHVEQLVHLLLVLGDGVGDTGVADGKDELARDRVLVERHRDGAQRLRRKHRRIEPGPVFADDDEVTAGPEAGVGQAVGHRLDHCGEVAPGRRLPDAELLLAQRRGVGSRAGVLEEQSGERGVHRRGRIAGL
jgi:hypothetical protein